MKQIPLKSLLALMLLPPLLMGCLYDVEKSFESSANSKYKAEATYDIEDKISSVKASSSANVKIYVDDKLTETLKIDIPRSLAFGNPNPPDFKIIVNDYLQTAMNQHFCTGYNICAEGFTAPPVTSISDSPVSDILADEQRNNQIDTIIEGFIKGGETVLPCDSLNNPAWPNC